MQGGRKILAGLIIEIYHNIEYKIKTKFENLNLKFVLNLIVITLTSQLHLAFSSWGNWSISYNNDIVSVGRYLPVVTSQHF